MNSYKNLLEPGYIGNVRLRNRIIKTGAGTSFIEADGQVGERIVAFYESLAKGGVGLIIVESTGVDYPTGIHHPSVQLHLEDDRYIPGYRHLTESVHNHDCPVFLQLFHSGPWHPSIWSGIRPIAASSLSKEQLPNPHLDEPREASKTELSELVRKFADAAWRAQQAGFDGVEINASSAHLINSFLSRAWNRRNDEYGPQTLENRARFLVQLLSEIKERTSSRFAVTVLLTGMEAGLDEGTTIEEACGLARIIEAAGADAIQVRAYGYRHYHFIHPGPEQLMFPEPDRLPPQLYWRKGGAGAFIPLSEAMKQAVSVPIIAVGRLDPELGQAVIRRRKADFIGMNRRLLADPALPRKIKEGRPADIAPCTACCYCWHTRKQNQPIRCRINSSLGHERELARGKALQPQHVLVAGAGPAGLEAARVAASNGHRVTVLEKERRVGGLLPIAALIKGSCIEDISSIITYYIKQLDLPGVTIIRNSRGNRDSILSYNPDSVILATGGKSVIPSISGIQQKIVVPASDLHGKLRVLLSVFTPAQLNALSHIWMPVGKRVTIIGSGIQGCELAEFLIKRKRVVTVVDTSAEPGEGIVPDEVRSRLLDWLKEKGVQFKMNSVVESIKPRGLAIRDQAGTVMIVEADTIIPALSPETDMVLYEELKGSVKTIYAAGDCRQPGLIPDAVIDGAETALKL